MGLIPARRSRSKSVVSTLHSLLQLDRESIEAYRLALEHLVDDPMARDTLESFCVDHERHVRELRVMLRAFGGDDRLDEGRLLPRGPTDFSGLPGTVPVLRALKANEDQVVRAYQAALSIDAPADCLDIVRRNCNDQLRHRAWLTARVDAFSRTSAHARAERTSRISVA